MEHRNATRAATWDVTRGTRGCVCCLMGFFGPADAEAGFFVTRAAKRSYVRIQTANSSNIKLVALPL